MKKSEALKTLEISYTKQNHTDDLIWGIKRLSEILTELQEDKPDWDAVLADYADYMSEASDTLRRITWQHLSNKGV